MGIDFHNQNNSNTYAARHADNSWIEAVKELVPIKNIQYALDVGCGGGIYSKALADMGIPNVMAIDFSKNILEAAKENCKEYENIHFKHGNAVETGLDNDSYDLLLERALIHHIKDLRSCFSEGYRVLKKGGYYIIQDRTHEDCLLKGDDSHIRGYFFEYFPKLIEKETSRRHESKFVIEMLKEAGFNNIEEIKLWETRRIYDDKDQLLEDLSKRTGRSILHDLNDEELKSLIDQIDNAISINTKLVEKDRWTVWKAVK
ncbi:SAM-dependent methyltransferase [Oceanobacillus arenosus]|uniref:SAM-dependent methyltransferase n=1 Tax=Oceanobacillus arenosus TaxID=1229153 RepID=A0A3D8PPY2_9BACI|nr:class I SAM-dependent methyltransferase [Oceanobacillus arenosus]RDW18206.1 SAM-dependent methyltransferase [Oceanobacillus arenosus]